MKTSFSLLVFLLLALCPLSAQVDVGLEFVTVGDPGNPPDPFTGDQYGAVSYVYRIGKLEVTVAQYVEFLNAVDPLGGNLLELYEPEMGQTGDILFNIAAPFGEKYSVGSSREDRPVRHVAYYSTLRFINWLNGGDTEDGAYELTGLTSPLYQDITRRPGALFWLPNQNEWYKAAYYHGPDSALRPVYGTDYSLFPMGGFIAIDASPPGDTDSAHWGPGHGAPVDVGSYPFAGSHYGTFDQGGNVDEWHEASRIGLGGSFVSTTDDSLDAIGGGASGGGSIGPFPYRGIRVAASIPVQPPPIVPDLIARHAVELEWQSQIGVSYQVQYSPDMVSWFNDGAPIPGDGNMLSVLRRRNADSKFWRVRVLE